MIEHPASSSFIAQIREPRALAGFVIGRIAADEAEVLSIGVAPEWQRRGIGRHMAEGLVRAARRAEVKRLFLEVAADNDAAIALYEGLGFKIAGARKAYYQRTGSAQCRRRHPRSRFISRRARRIVRGGGRPSAAFL